jgi:hypothetical protein
MSDNFNLIRNITESNINITRSVTKSFSIVRKIHDGEFSFRVPGFLEIIDKTANIVIQPINFQTTDFPHLLQNIEADIVISPITMTARGETVLQLEHGDTYTVNINDCFLFDPNTFDTVSAYLPIGYLKPEGWNDGYPFKTWIPFIVPLNDHARLTSATITVTATQSQFDTGVAPFSILVGCDNRGDGSIPTSFDELNMRTMTLSNKIYTEDVYDWAAGTSYTYDVTEAISEILNRPDWISGNILAVLILNYGTNTNSRSIASSRNGSYAHPSLTIDYRLFYLPYYDPQTLGELDIYTLGGIK